MQPARRNIQIPLNPLDPDGPSVLGSAVILSERDRSGVAEVESFDEGRVAWLEEFDYAYFQVLGDGDTLKAIRKATDEDIKKYRVPRWIQNEEIPICCDRPMAFVGQLDDNMICTEPPPDAKFWWHDTASFYVFTCSQCLSVQAVGQQF